MSCRPSIVRQLNMVAGFARQGQIISVYLPYYCETCDLELARLLDLRMDHALAKAATPPESTCPQCGAKAEFDDVPNSYFSFAVEHVMPSPSAQASALIDAAHGRAAEPSAPGRAQSLRPTRANDGVEELRGIRSDLDASVSRLDRMIKERKSGK